MLSVKQYQKVYQLLEGPLMKDGSDCGLLCNRICCSDVLVEEEGESAVLFLYPGEELVFQGNKEFDKSFTRGELELEEDEIFWAEKKKLLTCTGECDRRFRPLQCRVYPFSPYFEFGKFKGLFLNHIFQDYCPLLTKPELISPKFIKSSVKAWKIILTDKDVLRTYQEWLQNDLVNGYIVGKIYK